MNAIRRKEGCESFSNAVQKFTAAAPLRLMGPSCNPHGDMLEGGLHYCNYYFRGKEIGGKNIETYVF